MSKTAEQLLRDALRLGLADRAELAAELLASLDGAPEADVAAAWANEIESRAARARSGEDPGSPWAEIRERLLDDTQKH